MPELLPGPVETTPMPHVGPVMMAVPGPPGGAVDPETIGAAVSDYLAAHPMAAPVQSVAGRTGAVTLAVADVSGAVASTDGRLADARTPLAHKASHATGGTDALTPADIGAATAAQGVLAGSASQPGHTHTLDATTDTATRVAMTPAERTKLAGVATGSTANASDAQLRDRATHTGAQAISTVTGLQTALDGKAAARGADDNYVTDAEKVKLANLSGTNTGDQDLSGYLTTTVAPELIRDTMGTALVAGANVTITKDDAGDTITIASTAVLPTRQVASGTGLTGGGALDADRTLAVDFAASGVSSATKAVRADDSRLSDARPPTAHNHTGTYAPALGADDNYVTDAQLARLSTSDTKTVNTITAAASVTVSTAYAVNKLTMTQNTTITPSLTAGSDPITALHLSGAFVPTWAASIDWPDGVAPTYTSPALYVFLTVDGGTSWVAVQSGKAIA